MKNITDYLKVFKNIETYKDPEPRNMAQGPRTGFKEGNGVYDEKDLLGKRVRELMDEGYDFGEAVKQAMKEGYAEGGRIGLSDGQLVRNTVDGSRPGYAGVIKRQDKPGHQIKWRVKGERGGVDAGSE